ncbi:hypothetical protein [Mycobacterium kiyosense]|nr:hypothetical protein IWGMT90018_18870 [Mycobacterium kiyosense]
MGVENDTLQRWLQIGWELGEVSGAATDEDEQNHGDRQSDQQRVIDEEGQVVAT